MDGRTSVSTIVGTLKQNTPNPVNGTTTIRYNIPEQSTSVRLDFTNAKGQVVKTQRLNSRQGQISLNTAALAAGTYNYALYVDGQPIDTKRLAIIR